MTKTELIAKVAEETKLTKAQAADAVNATFSAIQADLVAGNTSSFIGFGTFSVKERAARTGRNPRTGEELKIKASKTVGFKAGKALKTAVNTPAKKGKKKK